MLGLLAFEFKNNRASFMAALVGDSASSQPVVEEVVSRPAEKRTVKTVKKKKKKKKN